MSAIELTAEDIERAHDDLAETCLRETGVDADAIARTIAARHQMSVKDMLSDTRDHEYIVARSQLYRALRHGGWSLQKIGRFCGNRDHTTIRHHLREAR